LDVGANVDCSADELVRRELVRYRGKEVDTVGDGFFASFDGPARAIRCACAIVDVLRELGLEVRVGLHTGECELAEFRLVLWARACRRDRGTAGAHHRHLRPRGTFPNTGPHGAPGRRQPGVDARVPEPKAPVVDGGLRAASRSGHG
jgi:hypothetical protein